MDFLKAEINRKRKLNETIHAQLGDKENEISTIGSSKFIKNSDRKRIEELALAQEQAKLDSERLKQNIVVNDVSSKKSTEVTFSSAEKKQISMANLSKLTPSEVKSRLRQLGQPITYFGESNDQRLQRFLTAVKQQEGREGGDDENHHSFKHRVVPDDEEEAALDAEDLREQQDELEAEGGDENHSDEDDDNDNNGTAKSSSSSGTAGTAKGKKSVEWDHTYHFSAQPNLTPEKVIYKFFRALVKQWEVDLSLRDDRERSTAKGKLETRTQKQCKDGIRPLFKLCKRKEVPYDILIKLQSIVKHCEEGNFRAANDQYIATAIGNSAWPIGLTMVGIHERSGREKISTSKVAHMMNNELQRKYFTSVKRLMTFAQNKRVDVAPSMKVLN